MLYHIIKYHRDLRPPSLPLSSSFISSLTIYTSHKKIEKIMHAICTASPRTLLHPSAMNIDLTQDIPPSIVSDYSSSRHQVYTYQPLFSTNVPTQYSRRNSLTTHPGYSFFLLRSYPIYCNSSTNDLFSERGHPTVTFGHFDSFCHRLQYPESRIFQTYIGVLHR